MNRDEFIDALADHMVTDVRNPTEFLQDAIVYGRYGLKDMSDDELRETAEAWEFNGELVE